MGATEIAVITWKKIEIPGFQLEVFGIMTDWVSKETRSRIMAAIPQKNTSPEMTVRSLIHRMGFRYGLHGKRLPGKPDIVLSKYKAVIFVHGCFWHQHPECKKAKRPASNLEYWNPKLDENVRRDAENTERLIAKGWRVCVVWQCQIKDTEALSRRLRGFIRGEELSFSLPVPLERDSGR
jgi:DNA mismatch endonuclease (patch repair protein)